MTQCVDGPVYGPNGFFRQIAGSIGSGGAVLDVASEYDTEDGGEIELEIKNLAAATAEVTVQNAYSGDATGRRLQPGDAFESEQSLGKFYGWYDVTVTVSGDPTFKYRLAGHVETREDSFSDPALGGLVTLNAEAKPGNETVTKTVA